MKVKVAESPGVVETECPPPKSRLEECWALPCQPVPEYEICALVSSTVTLWEPLIARKEKNTMMNSNDFMPSCPRNMVVGQFVDRSALGCPPGSEPRFLL